MITIVPRIEIDDTYVFEWVSSVRVESFNDTIIGTATVQLPEKVVVNGELLKLKDAGIIKEDMKIVIKLGYGSATQTVFKGYITSISASHPLVIQCGDELSKFVKKAIIPITFDNAKLADIVNYVADVTTAMDVVCSDVAIGKFIIQDKVPGIKILEELKRMYGFRFFVRNDKIYAGIPYWSEYQKEHEFEFGSNIFDKDSLTVVSSESQKLRLKAVSILEDNSKLEVEVGDTDGAIRTWYFDHVEDKESLKRFAETKLLELKYTGLKGSFKTFGYPQTIQGDVATLIDPLKEDRNGSYLIKRVVTRLDTVVAYEQEIYLGRKI